DIPATVLSRVQRFDFRPIAPEALAATLEDILSKENIPFDPAALPTVVRAAEGSLRDALSLLDTAIAYGNGRLQAQPTPTPRGPGAGGARAGPDGRRRRASVRGRAARTGDGARARGDRPRRARRRRSRRLHARRRRAAAPRARHQGRADGEAGRRQPRRGQRA